MPFNDDDHDEDEDEDQFFKAPDGNAGRPSPSSALPAEPAKKRELEDMDDEELTKLCIDTGMHPDELPILLPSQKDKAQYLRVCRMQTDADPDADLADDEVVSDDEMLSDHNRASIEEQLKHAAHNKALKDKRRIAAGLAVTKADLTPDEVSSAMRDLGDISL